MIHTFRVDHVLRETIDTPYRDLVTRPTGVAVRNRLQHAIATVGCSTALLDFSAVGLLDFSCADEVVAKLLLATDPDAERFVLLFGLKDLHVEAIDHVLGHQSIAVAAMPEAGDLTILGRVSPDARAAFLQVFELGPGDATVLANALSWGVDRAADALQTLALLRLVAADGGRYRPLRLT